MREGDNMKGGDAGGWRALLSERRSEKRVCKGGGRAQGETEHVTDTFNK